MRLDKREPCENELVNLSQKGNISAFAQLIDIHGGEVLSFVSRIVRSREDAEDISQEAFIKAYQSIGQFKGYSSFKTWLYAIAKNSAYSYLQKKNPGMISLDEKAELINVISVQYPPVDAESASTREDFLNIVSESLALLPPKYNTILQLFYFRRFKYHEISEILSIPMGTVKSLLHRALRALRKDVMKELKRKMCDEL